MSTMERWRVQERRVGRRMAAVMLLLFVVLAPMSGAAFAQPPTTAAQEGFVPVTEVPLDEQLPAAPLVIAAYSVAWIAVVVYLWSIWQRLSKVEREIAGLHRRIESGAGR